MKNIIFLTLLMGGAALFSTEGWGTSPTKEYKEKLKECEKKADKCVEEHCFGVETGEEFLTCLEKCFKAANDCIATLPK